MDKDIEDIKRRAGLTEMQVSECPPEVAAIRQAAVKDIHEELVELTKFLRFIPANYKDKFDDRLDSIAHHLEDIVEQS